MSKSLYILIRTLLDIGLTVAVHLLGHELIVMNQYLFFLSQSLIHAVQYRLPHPLHYFGLRAIQLHIMQSNA
jgi:hypothetical protein